MYVHVENAELHKLYHNWTEYMLDKSGLIDTLEKIMGHFSDRVCIFIVKMGKWEKFTYFV